MGNLMILRQAWLFAGLATFVAFNSMPGSAAAVTVVGTVEPAIPSGQFIELKMTINDTTTIFELTGPDFSWFALGFDTTTMQGYSLIVEGTNATRTVVEQNLQGIGDPGSPQATQNIDVLNTIHNSAIDLTTVIIERPNNTGDVNDPIFSPSMTSLAIIGAYDSFSSPSSPNPNLTYHGSRGRGFGTITFSPIPEPTGIGLALIAVVSMLIASRRSAR
jgi:hypothetical protein